VTRSRILFAASLIFLCVYGAWGALRSDEVWSVQAVSQPFEAMLDQLKEDVHPPLYYIVLFGWTSLFGTGELAVRALSAFFYLLSVAALYLFARKYSSPERAAIAAAIYAASPLALLSAQFVRMYALVSLLAILSTWLYFKLHEEGGWRNVVAFAAVNALGTFTHIWFFFLLFPQCVCTLCWRRRSVIRFAGVMAISLTPYAVIWLPVLLRQISKTSEATAWIKTPTVDEIGVTLLLHAGALLLLIPALLIVAAQRKFTIDIPREITAMLLITLSVPFAISFVKPLFYSRFTIVALHLFALVAAGVIGKYGTRELVAGLLIVSLIGTVYAARQHPGDALSTARYLADNVRDGDVVIFTSLTRMPVNHYLEKIGFRRDVLSTSFPSEIDQHPGYEGRITDPDRRTRYQAEAETLVRRVHQQHPKARVFFLHGFRPAVDAILQAEFDRAFKPVAGGYTHGRAHLYYTTVSVYAAR
jgi:mannosyltransferase